MRLTLPLALFPGASAFMRKYADGYAAVARWFHYDPHDPQCFALRLAELDARPPVDRRAAAQAAAAQQKRWGAGEAAIRAARNLSEPGTYAVVTGQQVGLFGGPLYTQLKAATAVLAARELGRRFPGRRFVPTFWMGTADSDFEEVRRTWVLDREGALHELSLPPGDEPEEGTIVAARQVREGLDGLLAGLEDALPGGPYRDEVVAALREAYAPTPESLAYGPGTGLAGGFARWMARLFVGTELVLLDPQDPALMRLAQPLIERELDAAAEGEAALERRNAEIAAAGFTPQVEHLPGDTNLFLLDARQRRRKIARDGAGFSLRQTGERYTRDELLNLAARQPERFVPGVMLRPVYQNTLFPPAAFIGGGAEIAYRAQATAVYEHHGQRMAPAFHRASATLLPAKSAALLAELGLELADCYCVPQDLEARAVAQSRPEEIERALAAYRALLLGADAELQALAGGLDATLPETFDTLRGNLERHVEKLEKKLTSALKHRHEALLRRAGLVQRQVYPQSAPQERVLGCLSFLPRAGSAIIARLLDELAPFSFTHRILVLD